MNLLKIESEAAPYALRAMLMIARAATHGFGQPQRAMLDAIQKVVTQTNENLETLKAISPSELGQRVTEPAQTQQLIRFMVVIAMVDGPPTSDQVSMISDFTRTLHVDEPAVQVIGHLSKGKVMRFRLAFLRRSHIRHYFRNTYRLAGGVIPVILAVLCFRKLIKDDRIASRFRALENLPKETLGYHFFRHCVDVNIPFPGERGGFPEGAQYHDVTHVLSGYDTSPEGELKNAAFQAGYTKNDHDFFTWLFAIVLHGTRVNMTPFPMPFIPGLLGQGSLAIDSLIELKRGNSVKLDLGDRWNFWEYARLPIDIVRERLGIMPSNLRLDDLGQMKPGVIPPLT